ncbi:MAG TPA: hypothetical protein VMC84_01335 [Methanocella sp.]|uniref:Pepco domain-containing protein n=1 Tax=Methanocella sp. TaxID=2052833 RepID=UPI002BF7D47C|nr:hypothetical protein [Methanocella sp.]HTY89796.1 hypothetical protein [Methanocella sp.]
MSEDTISVIAIPDTTLVQKQIAPEIKELPIEELSENISGFLLKFGKVMDGIPDSIGDFKIDSMSVSLGVSVDGTVSIFGIGGSVGGQASITITLNKK